MGREKKKRNTNAEEKPARKKKAEEAADYRRYPLWDNYRSAFSRFRKIMGARYLAVMGGHIVLAVLRPFAAMALPSAVVYLLGSGWKPELIFLSMAGYVEIGRASCRERVFRAV